MMNPDDRLQLLQDLQRHQAIARQVLTLVEQEASALRLDNKGLPPDAARAKRDLLPQLKESTAALKRFREQWQRLSQQERQMDPALTTQIRATQDLVLKVILLDRENEQHLLKQGHIPSQQLRSISAVRPHYATTVYQRHR